MNTYPIAEFISLSDSCLCGWAITGYRFDCPVCGTKNAETTLEGSSIFDQLDRPFSCLSCQSRFQILRYEPESDVAADVELLDRP